MFKFISLDSDIQAKQLKILLYTLRCMYTASLAVFVSCLFSLFLLILCLHKQYKLIQTHIHTIKETEAPPC